METQNKRKVQPWTSKDVNIIISNIGLKAKQLHALIPHRDFNAIRNRLIQERRKIAKETPIQEKFKKAFALLPEGEDNTFHAEDFDLPALIDFDLYAMRNGYEISSKFKEIRGKCFAERK